MLKYIFQSTHLQKKGHSSICVGKVIEYIVWEAIKGANKIKLD